MTTVFAYTAWGASFLACEALVVYPAWSLMSGRRRNVSPHVLMALVVTAAVGAAAGALL